MNTDKTIKVGVGVMIVKDGKVLLGKRKSSHGANQYSFPGGKLEYMESIIHCAQREVREETGLEIENIRFLHMGTLKNYTPQFYVDVGVVADWKQGEPKVLEPEKIGEWSWYDLANLPQPQFTTIPRYIEALKTGRNFFDN